MLRFMDYIAVLTENEQGMKDIVTKLDELKY